jgi:hypothetical protein
MKDSFTIALYTSRVYPAQSSFIVTKLLSEAQGGETSYLPGLRMMLAISFAITIPTMHRPCRSRGQLSQGSVGIHVGV